MIAINNHTPPNPIYDYGEYCQGWETIAGEFVRRFENMSHGPKVKKYVKFVEQNAMTDEWREEFAQEVSVDGEEQTIVNLIMFNRYGFPKTVISDDDTTRFTRTSDIEMYVFYSFQNFEKWERIMEEISRVMNSADRTLGRVCLTYTLPEQGESVLANFGGIDCHSAKITFKVQEAGVRL